ncbi:hypothetical protein M434DRAFT_257000 [Hypoxylon sp. CO27-5]|nr:hypothetical protein M434DRAFT_257000 [Hypoxylon sp. CO27-5]
MTILPLSLLALSSHGLGSNLIHQIAPGGALRFGPAALWRRDLCRPGKGMPSRLQHAALRRTRAKVDGWRRRVLVRDFGGGETGTWSRSRTRFPALWIPVSGGLACKAAAWRIRSLTLTSTSTSTLTLTSILTSTSTSSPVGPASPNTATGASSITTGVTTSVAASAVSATISVSPISRCEGRSWVSVDRLRSGQGRSIISPSTLASSWSITSTMTRPSSRSITSPSTLANSWSKPSSNCGCILSCHSGSNNSIIVRRIKRGIVHFDIIIGYCSTPATL